MPQPVNVELSAVMLKVKAKAKDNPGQGEEYKEMSRKLKAHIEEKTGVVCKFVNITKKGQGGAVFGSEEEAQAAIAAVNGTKFMGTKLEVDVWTKKE